MISGTDGSSRPRLLWMSIVEANIPSAEHQAHVEHLRQLHDELPDPMGATMTNSPELTAAMRLIDTAKDRGFAFERIAPGPDGPLRGVRESVRWRDEIYLAGFWELESCCAIRRQRSSLVVPGGLPVAQQLRGDALTVLHTVLCDWTT
jgi:hypothetical protein